MCEPMPLVGSGGPIRAKGGAPRAMIHGQAARMDRVSPMSRSIQTTLDFVLYTTADVWRALHLPLGCSSIDVAPMPPQTRSGEAGPSLRSRTTTSSKVKPPQHLEIPPTKAIHQSSPSSALKLGDTIGRLPDEVYDRALPPWRARWRRWLVRRLEGESEAMGKWQRRVRSEGRDAYFYWTALFGSELLLYLPSGIGATSEDT